MTRVSVAIILVSVTAVVLWAAWGIRDLTYAGDLEKIAYLTKRLPEFVSEIDETQSPEIKTWYFSKAQKYISDYTLIDATTGDRLRYSCTWLEDSGDVEPSCSPEPVKGR